MRHDGVYVREHSGAIFDLHRAISSEPNSSSAMNRIDYRGVSRGEPHPSRRTKESNMNGKLTAAEFASFLLGIMMILLSCAKLGNWLGTSDSENRAILDDFAPESFTQGSGSAGFSAVEENAPAAKCRENPLRKFCGEDAREYCEEFLPDRTQSAQDELGQESFQQRRQKIQELVGCLAAIENLSPSCQEFLRKRRPNPRRRACLAKHLLASCASDAQAFCGIELLEQSEVDQLTTDQRRERVQAIVGCLQAQSESVSAECQLDLDRIARKRSEESTSQPKP